MSVYKFEFDLGFTWSQCPGSGRWWTPSSDCSSWNHSGLIFALSLTRASWMRRPGGGTASLAWWVGTTSRCSHHGVSSVLTVQVGYGEADLGLRGSGHCDQERSKVVLCSPGISYHINYWWVPAALSSSALDMSGQVDQGAGALHPPLQHPPHLHAPGVGVRPGLHARRGRGAGDGPGAGGRGEAATPAQPRPLPAEVTRAGWRPAELQKVPSEANPKVRNHGEGPY